MKPNEALSHPQWRPDGTVLLIGGKPDGAIRALRNFGARVTCLARAKHAANIRDYDLVERVIAVNDPANVEDIVLALARHGIDASTFDVITSALEYGLVASAILGSLTGARAMPLTTALLMRDKHAQKAVLRAAGIRTAASAVFDEPASLIAAASSLGGPPVVVKPAAGAGSFDTHVLTRGSDIEAWVTSHSAAPWVCESLIVGDELHADGVVHDGVLTSLAISRYFANMITVQDGALNGSAMVRETDDMELYDAARTLVTDSLSALGMTSGVFHLEFFETEDGLVFSEVGGRVAGGRIDEMIRMASGVDLHRAWASEALGTSYGECPAGDHSFVYANLDLRAHPGIIIQMPSVAEIEDRIGVVQAELKLRPGSMMPPVEDTNTRVGRALLRGSSFAQVHQRAADLASWFASTTLTDLSLPGAAKRIGDNG